jgi:hypothetical protein
VGLLDVFFAPCIDAEGTTSVMFHQSFQSPKLSLTARTAASEELNPKGTLGLEEDMRRLLGALLLVTSLLLSSPAAYSCGDKLLIIGRPLHFKTRAASILAYVAPGSALEPMLASQQWTTAITKGKHRVVVILTPERLSQVLKGERFDLILIAWADATVSPAQLADTAFPAVVVPVVESVSRETLRNAEKEYGVAMKSTAKSGDYLSAIDRAVGLHDLRIEAARGKKNQNKGS